MVSNFIQTVPVNERILPESLRSAASLGAVGFGRLGRGGTDSTPCPAGHLFRNRLIVAVAANRSVSPRGSAAFVSVELPQLWQHASDRFS